MTKHVQFLELLIGPLANQGGGGGITPSGSIDINANGTYDVTTKASAVVAVPTGMSAADKAKWEAFCAVDCVNGEVPDSIEALPACAKYYNSNIVSVSAPQVKKIPIEAFYNDYKLQSVSFPEATQIGVASFYNCTALVTLNAPKVTGIDDNIQGAYPYGANTTFSGLAALTAINFPLLANIVLGLNKSDALFKGVNALASVDLSGLVSSDSSLIDGNNAAPLTGANIDFSNLERVTGGRYVLMQCPNITSLSFPKLTVGGLYKLAGLTSLSVPKITDLNLYGCDNLTLANITYDKTLVTTLTAMPKTVTALTDTDFPAVTELGSVCDNNTNLTNVSLSHVTTVGSSAFLNCTGLLNVSLAAATSIGQNAFKGCTYLATISLPNATTIGQGAFTNCKAVVKLNLPKLTKITKLLFNGCNALTEVVAGGDLTFENATSATYSMFAGCTAMEKFVLSGVTSVPAISYYALTGLAATCEIYVPDDLVNSFKSASNWSARASYIKKLSDYVPS